MLIRSKLSSMGFRQIWVLIKVFITKPFLVIPTYKATKETIIICNKKFGKEHHKDTRANAFRHALWNFLLCRKCFEVSKSVNIAANWSEKVTNLHELLSPNADMARIMDLHNNFIGRNLFIQQPELDIIEKLEDMMGKAVKARSVEEIKEAGNSLVYLED